jgi:hypothetical protein
MNLNLHVNTINILQDINIMSSSPSFCGICDIRHMSKQSEVWCPECDEGLCTEFSLINCSISLNMSDVLTSLIKFSRIITSMQSRWVSTIQIPQHGHSWSLQYKLNSLNQTKLSYKIDNGLKTIATNIQKFGEIVVESRPCEMIIVRRKDKQAQMMVAELSPAMSVETIQLNLKP